MTIVNYYTRFEVGFTLSSLAVNGAREAFSNPFNIGLPDQMSGHDGIGYFQCAVKNLFIEAIMAEFKAFQGTRMLCFKCLFKCGNNVTRTDVHESAQRLSDSKGVQCQQDECGTHGGVDVALKMLKRDDMEKK